MIDAGRANWTKHAKRWLGELQLRVRERQLGAGEVAYTLEPDLKDGHGGLRDVQSLWWAAQAGLALPSGDAAALDECYATLVRARVALHRATGRPGDVLRLEDQDAAAAALGARHCRRPDGRRRRGRANDRLDRRRGVGPVRAPARWRARSRRPGRDPRQRRDRAERQRRPDDRPDPRAPRRRGRGPPRRVESNAGRSTGSPRRSRRGRRRWPAGAADMLVALLLEGHGAVPVLEALDQRGLLTRLLPEWEPVRSRPQRNAYHRFTVDRHLWEAAANAAELVDRVARPDLLVLGALFHDIGKGYQGDHTEAGMEVVRGLGHRLGLGLADTDVLIAMVEHHLLLPDVAVRRDLTDSCDALARRRERRLGRGARSAARPHRSRLEGHRPVGVGVVEGGAGRRPRDPCAPRARWRRRPRADVAAVPRRRHAGVDGQSRRPTSRCTTIASRS